MPSYPDTRPEMWLNWLLTFCSRFLNWPSIGNEHAQSALNGVFGRLGPVPFEEVATAMLANSDKRPDALDPVGAQQED
jgi:hypothetical protein